VKRSGLRRSGLRWPLRDLFPDAFFIVVKRNPSDVISSLINGWRRGQMFRSYYVPQKLAIPGSEGPHQWRFALIDGWRDFASGPIPEIAFEQWRQCTNAIVSARALVAPERWMEVHLEDFLARPEASFARLCEQIEIQSTPHLAERLQDSVSKPVFAISDPGKDKWRRDNPEEIAELLPKIAEAALPTGYIIDPKTGSFSIR